MIANVALITAFLFVMNQFFRNRPVDLGASKRRKLVFGALCGGFGIVLMSYSFPLDNGVIADLRCLTILVAAQYGGFAAALPAGLLIALGRIFLYGSLNDEAAVYGASTAVVISIASGLAAYWIQSFWKRWTAFVLISILSTAITFYMLLGNAAFVFFLQYFAIAAAGIYFTAYLIAHLNKTTAMLTKLKDASGKDFLTGLNNRRSFNTAYQKALLNAFGQESQLSILLLDIDHFKQINDSYGHGTGDAVLMQFGPLLAGQMRSGDTISRIGGEEFAVLLPNCPQERAIEVAERLRATAESATFTLSDGSRLTVTISVGVATFPQVTAGELLQEADAALYEAKRTGRNKVCTNAGLNRLKRPVKQPG